MTEDIKEIERRLTDGGFLYKKIEKDEKLYPISLKGLLCLCSDLTRKNDNIFVQVVQEVIDENFSWNDGEKSAETELYGCNITEITVPPPPLESKHETKEKFEEKKGEYYKKVAKFIIPKIYEKIDSEKELNFIIWSSDEHKSLVVECNGNYYFLDSCGFYFHRFPEKENDGEVENDIFYIKSQVQADDVNCSSYCFEFMKQVIEIYRQQGMEGFNEYLKEYFNEDGHEYCVEYNNRTHGLLPPELLQYFQSLSFLKDISKITLKEIEQNVTKLTQEIEEINETNAKLIEQKDKLINDINKKKTEEKYSDDKYNSVIKEQTNVQTNINKVVERITQLRSEQTDKQTDKQTDNDSMMGMQITDLEQLKKDLINKRIELKQHLTTFPQQQYNKLQTLENSIAENNKLIKEHQQELKTFEAKNNN